MLTASLGMEDVHVCHFLLPYRPYWNFMIYLIFTKFSLIYVIGRGFLGVLDTHAERSEHMWSATWYFKWSRSVLSLSGAMLLQCAIPWVAVWVRAVSMQSPEDSAPSRPSPRRSHAVGVGVSTKALHTRELEEEVQHAGKVLHVSPQAACSNPGARPGGLPEDPWWSQMSQLSHCKWN